MGDSDDSSPPTVWRVPYKTTHVSQWEVKFLVLGTSSTSPCSVAHAKYCLQQHGFTISLWRANNSFGNSLWCLGVSMGPPYPLIRLTHLFMALQALHGGTELSSWSIVSLVGFAISFQMVMFICCYFPYSLFCPSLPYPFLFNHPILIYSSSLHNNIFYLPFLGRSSPFT